MYHIKLLISTTILFCKLWIITSMYMLAVIFKDPKFPK